MNCRRNAIHRILAEDILRCFLLKNQLLNAFLVVEMRYFKSTSRRIAGSSVPFSGTALGPAGTVARPQNCRSRVAEDPNLWPNSQVVRADPSEESHETLLAGARLRLARKHAGTYGQEVGRQRAGQKQGRDTARRWLQIVIEHLGIGHARHFDRNDLVPTRQVVKSKRWNSSQVPLAGRGSPAGA